MNTLDYREETITPRLAQHYLSLQKKNRAIIKNVLWKYQRDMENDEFLLTGEPIQFNDAGELINGQHRLLASIRSGKSFRSLVVRGVPAAAFTVIDSGRVRRYGDVLSIAGYSNANLLASAAKFQHHFDNDYFNGAQGTIKSESRPNNDQIMAIVSAHPGLIETASSMKGEYVFAGRLIGPALGAWLLYRWHAEYGDVADRFFSALTTGADLPAKNPALLLRNRLLANKQNKISKMSDINRAAITIKAFHAFREGREMLTLRMSENEAFPDVLGRQPLRPQQRST